MRPFATDDALGDADAGAVHQHARRPMRLRRRNHGRLAGRGIGDVAGHRDTADLLGQFLGQFYVEVAYRDLGALRRKLSRGGGAQSRCASGDDGGLILQLHCGSPW